MPHDEQHHRHREEVEVGHFEELAVGDGDDQRWPGPLGVVGNLDGRPCGGGIGGSGRRRDLRRLAGVVAPDAAVPVPTRSP